MVFPRAITPYRTNVANYLQVVFPRTIIAYRTAVPYYLQVVFPRGGFGALRSPLLPANLSKYRAAAADADAAGLGAGRGVAVCVTAEAAEAEAVDGCLFEDARAVALSASLPYSFLALEAKSSGGPSGLVGRLTPALG